MKGLHVRQEEVKGKTDDEIFRPEQATAFRASDLLRVQAAVT